YPDSIFQFEADDHNGFYEIKTNITYKGASGHDAPVILVVGVRANVADENSSQTIIIKDRGWDAINDCPHFDAGVPDGMANALAKVTKMAAHQNLVPIG